MFYVLTASIYCIKLKAATIQFYLRKIIKLASFIDFLDIEYLDNVSFSIWVF